MPTPDLIDRAAFATVSQVRADDPATWQGRVFLTFDIDWAHDAVVEEAVDLVEQAGLPATWFVTHQSPILERLRSNPAFELGIHPNFLPLLMRGDTGKGATAEEVIDRMLEIVPEAKAVRAHSLVQSGRLLQIFEAKGLTHEASAFVPEQSGMALAPWIDWFGITRVPYLWEDDFWCDSGRGASVAGLLKRPGLLGFDFHPIHIFLNSEVLSRYEGARGSFDDPEALRGFRNPGAGVGTFFADLLRAGSGAN